MIPPPPDIAIILCVHNGAPTVERAIRSILPQLNNRAVLFVVDDGSSDSTPEILRHINGRCQRFYTITLPTNRGKAAALAEAIRRSEARYYMYCDADDRFLPGAVDTMLNAALASDADIVFAPYIRVHGSSTSVVHPRPAINSLNDMPLDTVHFALWNKIIRSSLVKTFPPYPGIDRWEDLGMIARIMTLAERITVINTPVYAYTDEPSRPSLSRSPKPTLLADRLAIADSLIDYFRSHNLLDRYDSFIRHLKFCAKIKLARRPAPDLRKWRATYPEINGQILRLRHIPLTARIYFSALSLVASVLPKK